MFIQASRVPDIIVAYDLLVLGASHASCVIANMQAQTNLGGYNLIVSVMNTVAHPYHMSFLFMCKESELGDYYQGTELITYQEEVGAMHAHDAKGNPIQLKFFTLLVQKPE